MFTELKKGVYWVGVVDWALKHFHGHELSTHRGSSYNAYLIVDEKVALVDTVWGPFSAQLMENIRELVDPARIDYVIANHAEVDHSGGLPTVMAAAPNAELFCSQRGAESIEGHYHEPWRFHPIENGERLSLGANELVFIEAPFLHWPDSMFTYVTGHNILMSNDAFGQHYATAFRFNDEVDEFELYEEALKYYANILTPFSPRVTMKIAELTELALPIDVIAPSHGVIWRKNPIQIVEQYAKWAQQVPEPRAVVIYDTMWNGTRRMAEAIGEGLAESGVNHAIVDMAVSDRNDVLAQVFGARTIVVGSPTLNGGLLPTIMPLLTDLRGLRFRNKLGAAFGCYGWSAQSVRIIEEHFEACNIPLAAEGITCKWQPRPQDLDACREFGRAIAQATKQPVEEE